MSGNACAVLSPHDEISSGYLLPCAVLCTATGQSGVGLQLYRGIRSDSCGTEVSGVTPMSGSLDIKPMLLGKCAVDIVISNRYLLLLLALLLILHITTLAKHSKQ